MYTLVVEYPLRKFITTKILANNEYEEEQLAKGEAYLNKLLQVVPAYVENGRITGSQFFNDGTQILVRAEFDVAAESEVAARAYVNGHLREIPDTLHILEVRKHM